MERPWLLIFLMCLLHWSKASERSERALGSVENCGCVLLIDSEMAGLIKLKLGGMVEGMGDNDVKVFFWIHWSWPGSGQWATGVSSRPRGWQRDPKLGIMVLVDAYRISMNVYAYWLPYSISLSLSLSLSLSVLTCQPVLTVLSPLYSRLDQ